MPGNFSLYVTNKTSSGNDIYVRVRGDKLQENEMYTRNLNEMSAEISGGGNVSQGGKESSKHGGQGGIKVAYKHEEETRKRRVYSCLTQGGFTLLPHGEVMPFAVENNDRLMYISVHDGSRSWCWDMQVNPQQYGCVTIKEDETSRISVFPSNPEPQWFQKTFNSYFWHLALTFVPSLGDIYGRNPALQEYMENNDFPSDAVKVYRRSDNAVVYLAKVNYNNYPRWKYLTGVWKKMKTYAEREVIQKAVKLMPL